jgi:hypothetical protein
MILRALSESSRGQRHLVPRKDRSSLTPNAVFRSPAGPPWVRANSNRICLVRYRSEFALIINMFDGGRTRARTLDPLIKSLRYLISGVVASYPRTSLNY